MGNQGQLYFGVFLTSSTLLMAIMLLSGFLTLAILISMMRIYKKAGKVGISAIIPIWSQITLFEIVGKPWWYLLLLLIPIVNVVILIQSYILLAKRFGKGTGFGVAMVFLPMIFIPLLSFYDYIGDENADDKKEEAIYNPFNQTNVEQVMPETPIVSVEPVVPNVPEVLDNSNDTYEQINNSIPETIQTDVILNTELENVETVERQEVESEINIVENEQVNIQQEVKAEESVNIIPDVMPIPTINQDVSYENQENVVENPTVQDIQDALKINKEPVDIAFNSVPVTPVESVETLDAIETNETKEVEYLENQEEVIEMPEIAAKVCSACGVSLAEDVNFCTSCGTKV